MKKAVYPGSFDPITYGHIDIAKRALKVFDKLIIMITVNPNKTNALFSAEERIEMVRESMKECMDRIEITTCEVLTVTKTLELGSHHIVRGLRAVTDFEYEFQMTHANRVLAKKVDSIFFMTDNEYSFLSSNTVKEIAQFKGELKTFVPACVEEKLRQKFN
ncbi:pantetheine-phosphate adenylyltransferase [Candidatus Xianfuyuplasma coldseepsis]|uniref:Phosphopantetheine adenylyltransferase n=1 Tax=Candidatus Xianfuyuplasma coldseepsis TaxID=2782163 RepID=A0A7L7KSP0_9MOLU|nr:pantetheine-phosphate adenylyltransferase [Xianfuyuplasma coldseepsis]QMS85727.1 pantetheine-phosphate adenylyltransferase [Xianfuyuplasma coldseepsis]